MNLHLLVIYTFVLTEACASVVDLKPATCSKASMTTGTGSRSRNCPMEYMANARKTDRLHSTVKRYGFLGPRYASV